ENRAALRQDAAHFADVEFFETLLEHTIPRVVETENAVTTYSMCLTHDGANHGIETRAVAAAGEYADIHDIKAKSR
ncbi:MAG: hypothetical protein RL574_861, partial [Actinomycetota bacterium]